MLDKFRTLFVRDVRLTLTYRYAFILSWIAIPISVVSLWFVSKIVPPSSHFGIAGATATYFQFAVVNVAFLTLQTAALQGFDHSVRDAQMFGVLESLLATPNREELIVLGSAVWTVALAAIQVFWYLGVAAMLGLRLGNVDVPALALFALFAVTASAPIGILSASFVMAFKQGAPTSFFVNGLASLIGGVLFPVAILPGWLQAASWWLPIAHTLSGVRGAMHGASIVELAPDALWLAVATLVMFPLALVALRGATRRARFDGTLGQY
jgi:ABC-2 type transport system permease protein